MKKLLTGLLVLAAVSAPAWAADSGPKADVAAVRATDVHRSYAEWKRCGGCGNPDITRFVDKIDNVTVVGDYAVFGKWDGDSGGMAAYKRVSGERWKQIGFAGGVFDLSRLIEIGVPAAIARKLLRCAPHSPYANCRE